MTTLRLPAGAHLAPPDTTVEAPPGWRTDTITWDGADHQVTYDPRQVRLLRTLAGDAHASTALASDGWERLGTDRSGAQVWARDQVAAARARLDRHRQAAAPDLEPPGLP